VGSGGFSTPGSLDKGLAAFALVMLVMRITILAGVPLVVTYRLVQRLLALAGRREDEVPRMEPDGSGLASVLAWMKVRPRTRSLRSPPIFARLSPV
jgi:hypothetical protein